MAKVMAYQYGEEMAWKANVNKYNNGRNIQQKKRRGESYAAISLYKQLFTFKANEA